MPNTDLATASDVRRFVGAVDRHTLAVVMLKVTLLERAGTPTGCIFFQSHRKKYSRKYYQGQNAESRIIYKKYGYFV
jgi:hypothetical protein